MIVANGYIRVVTLSGDEYDAKGCPKDQVEHLGEPIRCNIVRNSYERRGTYDGGVFTMASYVVLIDNQPFAPCTIRLYDNAGFDLGEFHVHQNGIVHLFAVGAIQLTI